MKVSSKSGVRFPLAMAVSTAVFWAGVQGAPAQAAFEPILDPTAMDQSADPCVDFEKYACGKWIERTVIPADESAWYRSFSTIDKENIATNRTLLENFAAGKNLGLTQNAKKLGDFYAGCVDTDAIQAQTKDFLAREFAQLEELTPANLAQKMGELQAMGFRGFFAFGSDQDFLDSSKMNAGIDQGGTGLPSRDYYFEESKAEVRKQYIPHIAKMLALSGMSQSQSQEAAEEILKFETELARKALRPVERREPKNLYHMKTLAELNQLAPGFNWAEYFTAVGAPKFEALNVAVPAFFENLSTLLSQTSIQTLRHYLRWRILSALSNDLGGEFAQERHHFYGKTLSGQEEMKPRWKYCVEEADSSLADALGEAFVAETFGAAGKTKAMEILNKIQKTFESALKRIEWMDESTRTYAVAKLNAFVKKIGYPDHWRDLSNLKIGRNHLDNALACARFAQSWDISKIGKKVDRSEWVMTPSTVNAYYNPPNNEIVFPAGILQAPMFSLTGPEAANYGAFGAVIGHEMTHGFDDQGRKFDLDGNLKDWWTPGIDAVFDQKAQCLVEQYSSYTVADGVHLDGKLTLGENMADLGGLKMAYGAFKTTLAPEVSDEERKKEERKFFTAYGQIWCSKATPEYEKVMAATNPHAPGKYRINGVLSNTPEFAQAFGCSSGKPMAPTNRCSIW